ncbi:SapC family protein [Thalassotalea fusca]
MTNIVPISKEQHQNLKVANQRDMSHLEGQHIMPVSAREYAQAATSYPIVFVKDPESSRYRSVAMLGLEAGENLYYANEKWNAIFVPQSVSMLPFALGLDPEKENTLTACIDVDSKYVGEEGDFSLFDAEGNETEQLKNVRDALGRLYENEVATEQFIKELLDNDLLLELELQVSFNNNENKKLVGLYSIDEKKLNALSDDKVLDFHKRGLYVPIHAMLCASGQVNRLAQLRNQSENPVKVTGIRFQPAEAK